MHSTTIDSDKYNEKGKKVKSPKCYAGKYYYKKKILCIGIIQIYAIKKYAHFENYADITAEINNYSQELLQFLNLNPIIKYSEFKKKDLKYYYKNKYNFKIT